MKDSLKQCAYYWRFIVLVSILSFHLLVLLFWQAKYFHVNYSGAEMVVMKTYQGCKCGRTPFYDSVFNESVKQARRNLSSCSDEETYYEPKQRVLSYTLYPGKPPKSRDQYLKYLNYNINMMRKYYPGYTMRVYTNIPRDPEICSILCSNNDVFWCIITETPSHGDLSSMSFLTWRYLPFGDPTVEIMMSRDLDSAIIPREAEAVNDWLEKGDKAICIMRDQPFQNCEMLAGMWQANNSKLDQNGTAAHLRDRIIQQSKDPIIKKDKYGDQKVLYTNIYYTISKQIVAYDSYFCKVYTQTEVRPFLSKRGDPASDWVTTFFNCNSTVCAPSPMHLLHKYPCPVECRPEYGKNWMYC